MSNLNRILWSGLVLGIAACGDSVTVTQPPEPVPGIRSVSVAPDGATLGVGASLQMTAAVTADPGAAAPTIAWSSSDAAKASVGATSGIVTGVAPGAVAIKATATSGTSTGSGQASVTIVSTTAKVTGITVTPTDVSMTPTQEVQASANVSCTNCNNTTDKAVVWSSLSTSIATVDAGGKIKGVAVGSAVIKATSSIDAGFSAAIAVTVVPAAAPATVSIQSVTRGALGLPVDVANVFAQIEVSLNLDRGGEKVTLVELLVDGLPIGVEQVFNAPAASAEAGSPELAVEVVVMSWNTAKFNAVTGVPTHFNGEHTLSARVKTTTNSTGSASPSVKITLNNSDTFGLTTVVTGGSSANDGLGQLWQTGNLEITALPIIYSTANPVIQQVVLTPAGLASKTLTASPYKSTWAKATSIGGGGSKAFELLAPGTNGVLLNITSTLGGNAGPSGAIFTGIRLDNKGPGSPTFWANPNGRQNGWINGAVVLNDLNVADPNGVDPNGWLIDGAADGGVGGYTRWLRIGAGTTALALAAAPSAAATLPVPLIANTSYCAIASAVDNLNNESGLPASATPCNPPVVASDVGTGISHQKFGVDIAAPKITLAGAGLGANARISAATVGGEFNVQVQDTGTVGNSGMLSTAPVIGTVVIRNVAGSACLIGAGAACNPVSVNAAPIFPNVPTTTVAAQVTPGYYTYTSFAQDAAGNQSGTVTRVVAFDLPANIPGLTGALYNVPLNGPSVVFNANANDNLDLWDVTYTLAYLGSSLPGPIVYPKVVLNTFNAASLVYSNVPAGITIDGFLRQVQSVSGNTPLAAAAGPFKPTGLTGVARDVVGNLSAPAAFTAIAGANVTTGVSYLTAPAAQLIDSMAITNVATLVSDNGGPGAAVNPLSVTLKAVVRGATATFNPPFTRVDFYAFFGGNLVQIGSTTGVTTTDDGSAFGRRHTYSLSWTPGTAFGLGAVPVYAIGVNASGDGLVSPASGAITITNP
jgi:hypothetical protein